MRAAIIVTGPNASGKTTAVARVMGHLESSEHLARLRLISADGADKKEFFGGSFEESRASLRDLWRDGPDVLVFEGTVRVTQLVLEIAQETVNTAGSRHVGVFLTMMHPAVMRESLRSRCEARGKRFRSEYWTDAKLLYEGRKRLPNLVSRFSAAVEHVRRYEVAAEYDGLDQLEFDLELTIREVWDR